MKRLLSLIAVIFVILASFTISSHAATPQSPVSIVFDGKNATVRISINNTHYFYLQFSKIYLVGGPQISKLQGLKGESIKNMDVKKISGYSNIMGNYTKITMWKTIELTHNHGKYKNSKIKITIDFYIADKAYQKGDFNVNRSTIRYDTKIVSSVKDVYILLEEHMSYRDSLSHNSHVFECGHPNNHWTRMNRSLEAKEHRFGQDHKGMIGFGHNKVSLKYMWDYQNDIKTFYKYDGSQLSLYFSFKNTNGSIIQDPYIYLPIPITNSNPVVQGVQNVINYAIDHALSLGIGIIIAAAILFSAPLIRRFRL